MGSTCSAKMLALFAIRGSDAFYCGCVIFYGEFSQIGVKNKPSDKTLVKHAVWLNGEKRS